jgi:hypothetical protein
LGIALVAFASFARQSIISRLGEEERVPSLLDHRHRAVITFTYDLPFNITAGTVSQFASARPFNATTGIDNGDGANNDRPVINGQVIKKSAFRGTPTSEVAAFIESRLRMFDRTILLRLEGFNLLNHGNYLGRGPDGLQRHRDAESDIRSTRGCWLGHKRFRRSRMSIRCGEVSVLVFHGCFSTAVN